MQEDTTQNDMPKVSRDEVDTTESEAPDGRMPAPRESPATREVDVVLPVEEPTAPALPKQTRAPKRAPKRPIEIPPPSAAVQTADESDGEVTYYKRTKNFPKWAVVEPIEHGEFLIEFELRDVDERRLEVEIVDTLDKLELRAWVNRQKRTAAEKKKFKAVAGGGIIGAIAMYVLYAPLLPMVLVCTIAGLAMLMLSNNAGAEEPQIELVVAPDQLTLTRADEFRLRATPRGARWLLVDNTELHMATDRQVPVLELSREARMQADWFYMFVAARCQEIGSRARLLRDGGQPAPPPMQIAYEDETDQLAARQRQPAPAPLMVGPPGNAEEDATQQVARQTRAPKNANPNFAEVQTQPMPASDAEGTDVTKPTAKVIRNKPSRRGD